MPARDIGQSPSSSRVLAGAEGKPASSLASVSDLVMLAAVSRAEHHSRASGVTWSVVAQHLGFPRGTPRVGGLRAQLEDLIAAGALECSRRHGGKAWGLTSKGRRRLARARSEGKTPGLPEAPQHRRWRTAHEEAQEHINSLRTQVRQTLKDAQQLIKSQGSASDWARLSMTLRRQCAQLGWATYCVHDWAEPDDAHPDTTEGDRRRKLGLAGGDLTDAS
jgi:hypothetical protein